MRLVARTLFWPKDVSVELKGQEYDRGLILCFERVDFRWVASSIDEVMDIVDKFWILLWFLQMLWIFDWCVFFSWTFFGLFNPNLTEWSFSVRYSQSRIAANRRSHYNFNPILPDLIIHSQRFQIVLMSVLNDGNNSVQVVPLLPSYWAASQICHSPCATPGAWHISEKCVSLVKRSGSETHVWGDIRGVGFPAVFFPVDLRGSAFEMNHWFKFLVEIICIFECMFGATMQ